MTPSRIHRLALTHFRNYRAARVETTTDMVVLVGPNGAGKTLRDLRVAEIVKLDLQLDAKGKIEAYRAKLNVSFKFED